MLVLVLMRGVRRAGGLRRTPPRRPPATTSHGGGTDDHRRTGSTDTTGGAASGEPIKFGFDEGFTGFMAYDCELADQGVKTALAMLNNQWEGRPLQYFAEDNGSDPVVAVDKARKLVESDKINVMIGPIFSPSAKSVADYLGKSSGIPQISIVGQPTENLETANGLAFIHTGFFDSHGYYFGKYLAEKGYKTANVINYDDTPAYALTAGFKKAFVDEGGGTGAERELRAAGRGRLQRLPTAMKPADVTVNWIFGNGAVPVRQAVQRLRAQRRRWPPRCPTTSATRSWPSWATSRLGMIACDYYAYTIDNPAEQGLHRRVREALPGREADPAGLRRLAGRDDVHRGPEGDRWRHHSGQGDQGHVEHDHGHARPAR